MIRHFIAATLFACAVALAPSPSEARQPAQLMAGNPSGPNVAFFLAPKKAPRDFASRRVRSEIQGLNYPFGSIAAESGFFHASSRQTTASLGTTARDAGLSSPEAAPTTRVLSSPSNAAKRSTWRSRTQP
jgi:hypothetical protein